MTKKIVKQQVGRVTWHDLEDMDIEAICNHFRQFDAAAVLDVEYGYDCDNSGCLNIERLETDEEEAIREAQQAKEKAEREYQIEWTRLRREREAEDLVQSQTVENLALAAYLKKHEGNPRIDDMNNLFRVLIRAERDGHPKSGVAIAELRAMLNDLENYK